MNDATTPAALVELASQHAARGSGRDHCADLRKGETMADEAKLYEELVASRISKHDKCKASVHVKGMNFYTTKPCGRSVKVVAADVGYCKIHDPAAVALRKKAHKELGERKMQGLKQSINVELNGPSAFEILKQMAEFLENGTPIRPGSELANEALELVKRITKVE